MAFTWEVRRSRQSANVAYYFKRGVENVDSENPNFPWCCEDDSTKKPRRFHNLMTGENLELAALPEQPGDALPEGWSWQRSRQTRRVYLYNRALNLYIYPRVDAVAVPARSRSPLREPLPRALTRPEDFVLLKDFTGFVAEALRGPESTEARCRDYWLGGVNCLLPDMLSFGIWASSYQEDFRHVLWLAVLTAWLGCGGPSFAVMKSLLTGMPYLDVAPPPLPRPVQEAENQVRSFYSWIEHLKNKSSHSQVFSGDGLSVKFRLCKGVQMLISWHKAVIHASDQLERLTGSTSKSEIAGFLTKNPLWLDAFLTEDAPGLGQLTRKEVYGYVGMFFPGLLSGGCPWGKHALFGYSFAKGGQKPHNIADEDTANSGTQALLTCINHENGRTLQEALLRIPKSLRQSVPIFNWQWQFGFTCLDLEIDFCWFHNFATCKPLQSWAGFKVSAWTELQKRLQSTLDYTQRSPS